MLRQNPRRSFLRKSPEQFLEERLEEFLDKIHRQISRQNSRKNCYWESPKKFLEKIPRGDFLDVNFYRRTSMRNLQMYSRRNSWSLRIPRIPTQITPYVPLKIWIFGKYAQVFKRDVGKSSRDLFRNWLTKIEHHGKSAYSSHSSSQVLAYMSYV